VSENNDYRLCTHFECSFVAFSVAGFSFLSYRRPSLFFLRDEDLRILIGAAK